MTENSDKLDNMTVRRFAKLIKGNSTNNGSTGITTGTVIQNDNQLYVAVDDETLVPVSDTASNVKVGDKVTLAIDNEEALIVGNNSDASPTASELSETDTKATFAKVDASEAKDTAQTAQVTANTAQNTAETAQTTADNAQSTAQTAKETADAVDGKATEAKETATQAQATATTASETATQAQTTANTAKETADTASTKADNAQSTADTASSKADTAQETADNASKVATNYIEIDQNKGIIVGDRSAEQVLTQNAYINSEGFHIRDGETTLASFKKSQIDIGKSEDSVVTLNNGEFRISQNEDNKFTYIENKGLLAHMSRTSKNKDEGYKVDEVFVTCEPTYVDWYPYSTEYDKDGKVTYSYAPFRISMNQKSLMIGDDISPDFGVYIDNNKHDVTFRVNNQNVSLEGHTHTKSEISDFAHNHAGDALTPATINTTSTIKQNGTQVSLEGHTHEADDLTTTTPIFYLKTLSQTYTCNKASSVAISFTIPAITGYTCVGCVDWRFSNGSMLTRWNFAYNTKTWSLYGYNISSSSVSGTAQVKLLYVKSGWISCS